MEKRYIKEQYKEKLKEIQGISSNITDEDIDTVSEVSKEVLKA